VLTATFSQEVGKGVRSAQPHASFAVSENCPERLLRQVSMHESINKPLLRAAGLAPNAATDALHMALAAVHGMHYLLTWNCKHIANAAIRRAVEHQCRLAGYEPPVICTPQELLER
jgi:hypothetical protein